MSHIQPKTNFKDGDILYGIDLNASNEVIKAGVDDNYDKILKLQEELNIKDVVVLLAVTDIAPSECAEGDQYYNTITNRIYTAVDTNTWGEQGEPPVQSIIYIVFSEKNTYAYNGTQMISVGGGSGSEIVVGSTEPTEDTKLQIETMDLDAQYVDEPNIITASISSNYTMTTSSSYESLVLNTSTSLGNKLTLTNDGAILVGAGIHYVKISSKVSFNSLTEGLKWLTIDVNSSSVIANPSTLSARNLVYSPDTLVAVNPGDKIYLKVSGTSGDVIRSGVAYTNITVEAVS